MTHTGLWELKSHSRQSDAYGQELDYYEITDGKTSILSNDIDEESLINVVIALNECPCDFYLDDAAQVELEIECDRRIDLEKQNAEMLEALEGIYKEVNDIETISPPTYEKIKELILKAKGGNP